MVRVSLDLESANVTCGLETCIQLRKGFQGKNNNYNNTRKGTKKRKIKEKEPIRECILEILMTPSSGSISLLPLSEKHISKFLDPENVG